MNHFTVAAEHKLLFHLFQLHRNATEIGLLKESEQVEDKIFRLLHKLEKQPVPMSVRDSRGEFTPYANRRVKGLDIAATRFLRLHPHYVKNEMLRSEITEEMDRLHEEISA